MCFSPSGHHGEQATPEFHGRPVCQAAEHDMAHGADLAGHGVLERGISVAVDGAPPRGHPVDELRAVREHDAVVMGTRRGVHGKRMERRSVGMPEMLPVKGEHGCVVLSRSPAPGGGFLWRHVLHEITGRVLQPVRVGETRLFIRIEVLRVGQGCEERHARASRTGAAGSLRCHRGCAFRRRCRPMDRSRRRSRFPASCGSG